MSLLSYRSHSAVDPSAAGEMTLTGLWLEPRPAIGERGSRRRIERFATAASRLRDGKGGTDVSSEGDGGMSLLAHAFNAMAAQVQAREERLRAAYESWDKELAEPMWHSDPAWDMDEQEFNSQEDPHVAHERRTAGKPKAAATEAERE